MMVHLLKPFILAVLLHREHLRSMAKSKRRSIWNTGGSLTTNLVHQGVNKAVEVTHIKKLIDLKKDISIPTLESAVEELWGQSHSLIQKLPEGIKGLLFRQVSPSGVCAKAGIKNEDIILSINGKKYQRIEPFIDYIRSKSPGKKIE